MTLTIHRGINQIGGCITEIASASGTKILIDLGHNLPEGDNRDNDSLDKPENIDPMYYGLAASALVLLLANINKNAKH